MSGDGSPSCPIIQLRGGKDAAGLQDAEDFGEQRVLVRHMQQRVLGEDDVEGASAKGSGPGGA